MTKELLQRALDALTTAVKQNQYDMLMTGSECRIGEAVVAALQEAIAQPAVITPAQAKELAKQWHGEAGGELLPQLTANELAGILNQACK